MPASKHRLETLAALEEVAQALRVDPVTTEKNLASRRRSWEEDGGGREAAHNADVRTVATLIYLVEAIGEAHAGCRRGRKCKVCPPLHRAVAHALSVARHEVEVADAR